MEHKWPIADARFFKVNGGNIIRLRNSCNLQNDFYNYAVKFKKSAHLLTEHLIEGTDISKLDTYFFAVAYLYRHSLELILKAIGFKHIITQEERKVFLKDTFHNLLDILTYIAPNNQEQLNKDLKAYEWLRSFFKDINAYDKEADSFRYPFGISMEKKDNGYEKIKVFSIRVVFDKQTHIDLVAFANKLEVVYELLDALYQERFGDSHYYKDYHPVFFEEGGSYYGQSVVGYHYNSKKFYPYVKAYTESAELFYYKICENEKLKDDLFNPMVYLYRNAVELSLKEILLEECSFDFQEALRHIGKKKHKVLGLWNLIKSEIEEHADAPDDDTTLIDAENYIVQLNNIDGASDKFRYPADKNLGMHFKDTKKFDIDNVNDFFGQLLSFLSAVDAMMSAHNEWKAEMEAEYRAEMESSYDLGDYY